MQYLVSHIESEEDFASREHPEKAQAYWGAWSAYIAAMAKAGIMVKGAGLMPPHAATTVRVRDGGRKVQDGPFANTKEQLGGVFIIEVDDIDAALKWAEKSPCATTGAVEVRPVLPMPGQ